MREPIFSEGDFTLVKETGTGMNNTPWEGLKVISDGNADKHVIEVRLETEGLPSYHGDPVHNRYNGVSVAHGMRMATDTLAETEEYIEALKSAVDFARRVNAFIRDNDEWRGRDYHG